MGHLPGSIFYASFACVVQDQGKMGCAEYKTALNTSAMCECSISYQNIAWIQQGTDVKAWAEDFADWSYLCYWQNRCLVEKSRQLTLRTVLEVLYPLLINI